MTSTSEPATSETNAGQPGPPAKPNRPPARGSGLSETRFALLLTVPALTLFTFIVLYPLVNSMYVGLTERSLLQVSGGEFVGLSNVRSVLEDEFFPVLRNTLVFTVGATLLPFVIGLALAVILNAGIRGQAVLRGMFLFPWLFPGVIVSFLWLWIFDANYGVLNGALSATGIIDNNVQWLSSSTMAMAAVIVAKSWHTFPWMAVMLLAGLQTVPKELLEAAEIDGASRWQTFFRITVPQLRGIILIVLLIEFIYNFQHFETIYVMTAGGPAGATTTFSVAVYQTAFEAYDLGKAGALGILWMALLSVLVFVYVRFGEEEEAA